MKRRTQVLAGASIVLAFLTFGIADQLRMVSEPPESIGMVDTDYDVESGAARLADLQATPGPFAAAGWVEYLSVLLAVIALVAIWRLAVGRAPRWAWAGLILAGLGVFGRIVHLTAYYALSQAAVAHGDLTTGAELMVAAEEQAFFMALFVPFLLGLLAPIAQIVALRRARVVPLWSALAVGGATALMLVTGSVPWASALYTTLLVAGFTPAALAFLRGRQIEEKPQPAVAREPIPA